MEQKPKVRIYDSGFTPYVKSASLREENKDVFPTYFEWDAHCGNLDDNIFVTDGQIRIQNGYGKNTIAWLLEPRELHPENYDAVATKHYLYKNILTYDKSLLDKIPNGLFYPLGGSSIAFDKWKVYPKTKKVCMFVSSKETTEGHKLRHKIVESNLPIDFYGDGVGNPVKSKYEILKEYQYCVVVESCNIDWYFSEKLIDCFAVGTVPIYHGTDHIYKIFNSYGISGWRGNDLQPLKLILDRLQKNGNNMLMQSSREAIRVNLEKAKNYRICEDWIYTKYPELFDDRTL